LSTHLTEGCREYFIKVTINILRNTDVGRTTSVLTIVSRHSEDMSCDKMRENYPHKHLSIVLVL
jgi:hypothetical protein